MIASFSADATKKKKKLYYKKKDLKHQIRFSYKARVSTKNLKSESKSDILNINVLHKIFF